MSRIMPMVSSEPRVCASAEYDPIIRVHVQQGSDNNTKCYSLSNNACLFMLMRSQGTRSLQEPPKTGHGAVSRHNSSFVLRCTLGTPKLLNQRLLSSCKCKCWTQLIVREIENKAMHKTSSECVKTGLETVVSSASR